MNILERFYINNPYSTIILLFDISGSTTEDSFNYYRYIYDKYSKTNAKIILIGFTTEAFVYSDIDSLINDKHGGSFFSPALKLAEKLMYCPKRTLIVLVSDGDVWGENIDRSLQVLKELSVKTNILYIEAFAAIYGCKILPRIISIDNIEAIKVYRNIELEQGWFEEPQLRRQHNYVKNT
jgi:uncharacterized sporulation protein YeaH/YhbH (DUF444 family)